MIDGNTILALAALLFGVFQWYKSRHKDTADTYESMAATVNKLSAQVEAYRERDAKQDARIDELAEKLSTVSIELERSEAAFIYLSTNVRDSQPLLVRDAMRIRRGGNSAAA